MNLEWFSRWLIPTAFSLLPNRLGLPEAKALVTAICLQESALQNRKQIVIPAKGDNLPVYGAARGLAQFEPVACIEVMGHHATRDVAKSLLKTLLYTEATPTEVYAALEHNDILAVTFARLLLWRDPKKLPEQDESEVAWNYYLRNWRPGKPHEDKWEGNFNSAWNAYVHVSEGL